MNEKTRNKWENNSLPKLGSRPKKIVNFKSWSIFEAFPQAHTHTNSRIMSKINWSGFKSIMSIKKITIAFKFKPKTNIF